VGSDYYWVINCWRPRGAGTFACRVETLLDPCLGVPAKRRHECRRGRLRVCATTFRTIKVLAEAGFQTIELCSPVGYADSGFGGLAKYKSAELRRILGDAGVKCESSHFDIGELRKDLAGRIAWANDLGLTQMLVPSLDGPKKPAMDDVKRAAEEYNKMGEQSAKAGIRQGLHNEGFELTMVGGKRTYDILIELLDPRFVNFQFQVSTISKGFDAAEYFTKYRQRSVSAAASGVRKALAG
jgi:sugar phosphate isomerase/epimerase